MRSVTWAAYIGAECTEYVLSGHRDRKLCTIRHVADVATKADPTALGWAITDPITHLRIFGTKRTFRLDSETSWMIGSAPECSIQIDDTSGRLSRRHATLNREGSDWIISDLGSTNGVKIDGEPRRISTLAPGLEIDVGAVTLIAESDGLVRLRSLLGRFLGWEASRAVEVDRAMRIARETANLRAALIVRGEGVLSGFARRLHRMTLGAERPLAVHAEHEKGMAALMRAVDGSLFVDAERLPRDIRNVVVSLRMADKRVRLIVGANSTEGASEVAALIPVVATIWVPPLRERADEMDRVLEGYARDAAEVLGATAPALREHDPRWIAASGIATHEDAETVMLRVVAIRNWGVTGGAERLGITHGALSRWARRRKIPS
jgi:Inner membrane component of T3SS, cytoplasmic domain